MKIYKGYELIKEIGEGNIKDGTRFVIEGGEFDGFYATYKDKEIIVGMFGKELKLTTKYLIDNCTFEIVEDEIDIQDIKPFKIDENNYIQTDLGAFKTRKMDIAFLNKINDLVIGLKQLDNKINNT